LYRAARFHAAHTSALLSTESLGKARGVADDIGRADLDVSIKKEWRHNRPGIGCDDLDGGIGQRRVLRRSGISGKTIC
jgi:hypothetical protein